MPTLIRRWSSKKNLHIVLALVLGGLALPSSYATCTKTQLQELAASAQRRFAGEAASARESLIPFSARFEEHVFQGEMTGDGGGKLLASGMHTDEALREVVRLTGVTRASAMPSALSRAVPDDLAGFRGALPLRTSELSNGVTRVFVPRAMMNKNGWTSAASSIANSGDSYSDILRASGLDPSVPEVRSAFLRPSSTGVEGLNQGLIPYVPKTLFPNHWDAERIRTAARSVVSNSPVEVLRAGASAYEGIHEGVRIRVVVDSSTGEIKTAYPTWNQP
jgi:hypothetical protein